MATVMDKQTFLNLAPEYYMLAFFMHLQKDAEFYTDIGWRRDFSYYDMDAGKTYCFVERSALRSEAIRLMHKLGAITFIDDPFGPTIWQKTENLTALGDQLANSPASVFFKARAYGDPRSWLNAALQKVNRAADELEIIGADFPVDARADITLGELTIEATAEVNRPDEWSPITIDQADPVVADATTQLNAATEAIEQDNGYAVTHPQERDAVVQDITPEGYCVESEMHKGSVQIYPASALELLK
jgi:hypothetical protein